MSLKSYEFQYLSPFPFFYRRRKKTLYNDDDDICFLFKPEIKNRIVVFFISIIAEIDKRESSQQQQKEYELTVHLAARPTIYRIIKINKLLRHLSNEC